MQKNTPNNNYTKDVIDCAQINKKNRVFSYSEEKLKTCFTSDNFALDFLNRMEKNWKQNIEPTYKALNVNHPK